MPSAAKVVSFPQQSEKKEPAQRRARRKDGLYQVELRYKAADGTASDQHIPIAFSPIMKYYIFATKKQLRKETRNHGPDREADRPLLFTAFGLYL